MHYSSRRLNQGFQKSDLITSMVMQVNISYNLYFPTFVSSSTASFWITTSRSPLRWSRNVAGGCTRTHPSVRRSLFQKFSDRETRLSTSRPPTSRSAFPSLDRRQRATSEKVSASSILTPLQLRCGSSSTASPHSSTCRPSMPATRSGRRR